MRIVQTCGKSCPRNNVTVAQGAAFPLSVWNGQLVMQGQRYTESCPECGHIAIFICENEPRCGNIEAQETGSATQS
jgi:hypothetical protein